MPGGCGKELRAAPSPFGRGDRSGKTVAGASVEGSEDSESGDVSPGTPLFCSVCNSRRFCRPKQQNPSFRSTAMVHKMKQKPPTAIPIKASSPMGDVFATCLPAVDDWALTPAFAPVDIKDIARVFDYSRDVFKNWGRLYHFASTPHTLQSELGCKKISSVLSFSKNSHYNVHRTDS